MSLIATLLFPVLISAHIAAFAPGMYCQDGLPGENNKNSNLPHDRKCDTAPPAPVVFLELPVGGNFTVEHANNQAFTTLSYDGTKATNWPDGGQHPDDWNGGNVGEGCIDTTDGGYMHTQNQSMAQGTAFAIAYESNLTEIGMEDLVVFSVLEHTPWSRLATYQVPAGLPACPEDGCTCARMLVPRGCGQPNMYMQGFKCKTTSAVGDRVLAKAQPPKWCADDATTCRKGAKQLVVFNQLEGNNVVNLPDGDTPAYRAVPGFKAGAQTDIFLDNASSSATSKRSTATIQPTSVISKVDHHGSSSSKPATSAKPTTRSSTTTSRSVQLSLATATAPSSAACSSGYGGATATVTVTVTA